MPVATGSLSDLGYLREASNAYGVAVTGARFKTVRRKNAGGLNLTKDSYDSEEVRSDRQLSDSRHGIRRAGGDVECELSPGSYDDFLCALLGHADTSTTNNGWTLHTGTAVAQTVTVDANGVMTLATPNTLGAFRAGMPLIMSGSSNTAGNGKVFLITKVIDHVAGTYGISGLAAGSYPTATLAALGKRANVGVIKNSYTLERAFLDLALYQYYTGMRVNSAAFSLPPTGIAGLTFNFLGQNASQLNAGAISGLALVGGLPYDAAPTNSVLAAAGGSLGMSYNDGSAEVYKSLGTVTGLDFTVDNQMGGAEVVGKDFIPDIVFGNTQVVSGKVTVLFDGPDLYNLFEREREAYLSFLMTGPGEQSTKFFSVHMNRVKFNTGNIGDAVATGLPVEMDFRALRPLSSVNTGHIFPGQINFHTSIDA